MFLSNIILVHKSSLNHRKKFCYYCNAPFEYHLNWKKSNFELKNKINWKLRHNSYLILEYPSVSDNMCQILWVEGDRLVPTIHAVWLLRLCSGLYAVSPSKCLVEHRTPHLPICYEIKNNIMWVRGSF